MAEREQRMSREQPLQGYAIKPGDLLDDDLMRCVDEAVRRGLGVDRRAVEEAYEDLFWGLHVTPMAKLGRALFPDGGDHILAVRNGKGHVT